MRTGDYTIALPPTINTLRDLYDWVRSKPTRVVDGRRQIGF